MSEILAQLALVVAALFTGAAVYVNAVEHPARRHLDPRAALHEWQPAYKRGAAMQSTLALLGFVLAATSAWLGAGPFVALGAALMIAPWPWTVPRHHATQQATARADAGQSWFRRAFHARPLECTPSHPHPPGRSGNLQLALGVAPVLRVSPRLTCGLQGAPRYGRERCSFLPRERDLRSSTYAVEVRHCEWRDL